MNMEKPESAPQTPKDSEQINDNSENNMSKKEIIKEMKKQILLAGPLIIVFFCLGFIQMVCLILVGHLGQLALSGASIATAFASMAGYTVLRGMGSALETFSGQSYGAQQYRLLGIHLQRGMLILLILSIPIGILFTFSADILKLVKQNPEIANEAGKYARFLIPGFFGISILECHIRFLQTQSRVVAVMISAGITLALHIPICWLLVYKSGLRELGAALANTIASWIIALLLMFYVWFSPSFKETWTGFSREAFQGIPKFLKLAIPATIMLSLEVWSLEIVILLSGILPNPKLEASVLSISFNMHMMAYMIPFGLSGAVSTRVSNELGAGRPQAARRAVYAAIIMVIIEGTVLASAMIACRNYWGYLFSKEMKVVKYAAQMMPLLAISHFINGFQTVLSGTCRGSGLQKIGAFVNLGAYYLVGIPCAVVLAFVFHIGGKGLWIGITVAMFVQATTYSIIILCLDWNKQARKAKDRVQSSIVTRDNSDELSIT